MLQFDPDHIDDLIAAWERCPPVRWVMAAYAGWKPPDREPLDLPDGSFAAAKAASDDLFKDPARFFQTNTNGSPVKMPGHG